MLILNLYKLLAQTKPTRKLHSRNKMGQDNSIWRKIVIRTSSKLFKYSEIAMQLFG